MHHDNGDDHSDDDRDDGNDGNDGDDDDGSDGTGHMGWRRLRSTFMPAGSDLEGRVRALCHADAPTTVRTLLLLSPPPPPSGPRTPAHRRRPHSVGDNADDGDSGVLCASVSVGRTETGLDLDTPVSGSPTTPPAVRTATARTRTSMPQLAGADGERLTRGMHPPAEEEATAAMAGRDVGAGGVSRLSEVCGVATTLSFTSPARLQGHGTDHDVNAGAGAGLAPRDKGDGGGVEALRGGESCMGLDLLLAASQTTSDEREGK